MKTMKKLLALVLALTMVFALATTAFAIVPDEDTYYITVTNTESTVSIDGNEYTAFKIFDVTVDGTNYAYTVSTDFANYIYTAPDGKKYGGDRVTSVTGADDGNLVEYLESISTKPDLVNAFAKDAYDKVCKNLTGVSGTASGETATIPVGLPGYYLVYGTANPKNADDSVREDEELVSAVMLNTAAPNVTVNPKVKGTFFEKELPEGDDEGSGKGTAQDVGTSVKFTLTGTLADLTGYTKYKFTMKDTLSTGLKYDVGTMVVTANGTTLTENTDYKLTVTNDKNIEIDILNIITVAADGTVTKKYANGTEFVATYTAKILDSALGTKNEWNNAYVDYSNDPYNDSSHETTPPDKVYVYDFEIIIDKVDGTNTATKLEGAEFVLKNEDGDYYFWNATTKKVDWVTLTDVELETMIKAKQAAEDAGTTYTPTITFAVTDDKGAADDFKGLDAGTYSLKETKAPAGYNLLIDEIEVTIEPSYNEDGTINMEGETTIVEATDGYTVTSQIANNSGTLLPTTGGMGTTLFYVLGSIMMIGAAVLLVAKKRTSI